MPNETLINIDAPAPVFPRGHMADALVEQAGIEYWEARKRQQAYYEAHPPYLLNIRKKTPWERFCDGVRLLLFGGHDG